MTWQELLERTKTELGGDPWAFLSRVAQALDHNEFPPPKEPEKD